MRYTEGTFRRNPNWQDIEPGDPVVSDYVLRQQPNGLAFVPFLFAPKADEPDRTICPLGGSLVAELCFPYGALIDLHYAPLRLPERKK